MSVATYVRYMETKKAIYTSLVLLLISTWNCAMPPSSVYGSGANNTGSTNTNGSDSNTNPNVTTTTSTNNTSTSAATSASTTTATTTVTPAAETCTINTLQIVQLSSYYYLETTLTVNSTVQITSVEYQLSSGATGSGGTEIGYYTAAPYKLLYAIGVAGSYMQGTFTLTASMEDVNGNTNTCSTSFQLQ